MCAIAKEEKRRDINTLDERVFVDVQADVKSRMVVLKHALETRFPNPLLHPL